MEPKVSVIIPVYNTEKYLRACLDSVLGQTLKEIQVICVDDGSTDGSLDILREYAERDERLTVVTQPNRNAGAARNHGMEYARGEYLSFLDADDYFRADMLEKCTARMDEDQSDVLVYSAAQHNMRTDEISDMPWSLRLEHCQGKNLIEPLQIQDYLFNDFQNWPWNKLFRRLFIQSNHISFQEITRTNDMAFVCQALALASRISLLNEPFATYRVETGCSLQQTNDLDPLAFTQAFIETKSRLLAQGVYQQFEQSFLNNVLSGTWYNLNNMKDSRSRTLVSIWIANDMDGEFHIFSRGDGYFRRPEQLTEILRIREQYSQRTLQKKAIPAPLVSIIMPSLNVAQFMEECISSVSNQTMEEIEIICVDAGSTDGTLEILDRASKCDERIRIIHSPKKSYGYQMNLGIDAARGKYIGIVETDDWIEPDMFERLYQSAKVNCADMVKCNYYWYTTSKEKKSQPFENLRNCTYDRVFSPREDPVIFTTTPAIWSGLYAKSLLERNKIRFHESPGASFQDTSFHFMVCTVSERCFLIRDFLHHYRKDNAGSSVHSKSKVFCISDEMHYYEAFLAQRPEDQRTVQYFYQALKYEKYRWNYSRLEPQNQWEFLYLMHQEFRDASQNGLLRENVFRPEVWAAVMCLVNNPVRYFRDTCKIYSTRPDYHTVFQASWVISSEIQCPKISVIIPAYNAEAYLAETLDSVLNQNLRDIEIVCIDDGSTDGTLELACEYASRDHRISVLKQTNQGQSTARNVGISSAKGEYLIFLDSDDLFAINGAETLYRTATGDQLDVVYYDGKSFYENEKLKKKYPYYITGYEYPVDVPPVMSGSDLFQKMKEDRKYRVSPCLGLYRRAYLIDNHFFFKEGIIHEDNLFTLTTMVSAKRVTHIRDQFLIRRVHEGSTMTHAKGFMNVYGYFTCAQELIQFSQRIPFDNTLNQHLTTEIETVMRCLRADYRQVTDRHLCRNQFSPVELLLLDYLLTEKNGRPQSKADTKNAPAVSEADLIRASWTYRIGRFITFIPRKIRGGIRCYQENGWSYTWRRVLVHLRLKKDPYK